MKYTILILIALPFLLSQKENDSKNDNIIEDINNTDGTLNRIKKTFARNKKIMSHTLIRFDSIVVKSVKEKDSLISDNASLKKEIQEVKDSSSNVIASLKKENVGNDKEILAVKKERDKLLDSIKFLNVEIDSLNNRKGFLKQIFK